MLQSTCTVRWVCLCFILNMTNSEPSVSSVSEGRGLWSFRCFISQISSWHIVVQTVKWKLSSLSPGPLTLVFLELLVASIQPTLDFCRRLDSVVGPQLTVLASDICEQFNINKRISGFVLCSLVALKHLPGSGWIRGFYLERGWWFLTPDDTHAVRPSLKGSLGSCSWVFLPHDGVNTPPTLPDGGVSVWGQACQLHPWSWPCAPLPTWPAQAVTSMLAVVISRALLCTQNTLSLLCRSVPGEVGCDVSQ